MNKLTTLAAAAAMAIAGSAASAATVNVTFDELSGSSTYTEGGFNFAPINGTSSSNCPAAPCAHLNNGAYNATEVTAVGGGVFSLLSFAFNLNGGGSGNTVYVESNKAGSLLSFASANLSPVNLANNSLFQDITALRFWKTGGGNAYLDNLSLDVTVPAPVPLPAAGLMLLAGVGGLAAMRRRKTA